MFPTQCHRQALEEQQLHFASPQAYLDIYNSKNRWNKEESLYHSFGEDRSSFGFLTFNEARERRDVVGRMFSPKAVESASGLLVDKVKFPHIWNSAAAEYEQVKYLCEAFERCSKTKKPIDLFFAYRCFTMDVITYLCFGRSANAIEAPDFRAPIIEAMDASMPVFVRFKHAAWYKNMIMNCPPNISRLVSPATTGLVDLQQVILWHCRAEEQH
jgi:hypothetical protein